MRVVFGVDLTYFYWSCAAGIVLAALYDILRIKRRLVHTPDLLVNIEDFICLVVFGIIIIYTAYEKNNGNLRLYGIVSAVTTFAVYRLVIGNAAVRFLSYLLGIVTEFVKKALVFFAAPFRIIYSRIAKSVSAAASKHADTRCAESHGDEPKTPTQHENL